MSKFIVFLFIVASIYSETSFSLLKDSTTTDISNFKRREKLFNPYLTTSLSLIPGGGQLFTAHFTRGTLFLGSTALLGSMGLQGWKDYRESFSDISNSKFIYDSLLLDSSVSELEIIKGRDSYFSSIYLTEQYRLRNYYNRAIWTGGLWIWSIIDGYAVSNRFMGSKDSVRSSRKAALLSAIPFSGAGQVYNGKLFKAGLVSTIEISCMLSAINFRRLMAEAEGHYTELSKDSLYRDSPELRAQRDSWKNRYNSMAEYRSAFIWYGVVIYFYGLVDAVVDAHLNKFDNRFKISADLNPQTTEFSTNFTFNF